MHILQMLSHIIRYNKTTLIIIPIDIFRKSLSIGNVKIWGQIQVSKNCDFHTKIGFQSLTIQTVSCFPWSDRLISFILFFFFENVWRTSFSVVFKNLCHKIVWTVHNSVTQVFFLKAIIVFWYAPEVLFVYFSFLNTEYWHLLKGSDLLKLITQFHHGHSEVKLSIYLIWCHCLDWHQGTSTLPTIVFVPSVQIQQSNKFR